MRLTHLGFILSALLLSPLSALAAPRGASVRAIAFVASNERGATDPQLARYESVLRANLRFESFHFVGESSASVPRGGSTTLDSPTGRIDVRWDSGDEVTVRHHGTTVSVSVGHPAVFLGGSAGGGRVSGVIVLLE